MPEVSIDLTHQKVHEGVTFTANYLEKALANNVYARLHVKTGAKSAHILIESESEGKVYFRTISGATITADGTAPTDVIADDTKLTLFNRVSGSPIANTTQVFHTPTFTGGKLRGNRMFPFGTGGTATGGQASSRVESIVPANTSIIIELQNVSGQTRDIGLVLDWYEVIHG